MSMTGRRPIAGMERTPSGAISRSKASIAKRAEKVREAQRAEQRREARFGRTQQERSQQARQRVYGLTPAQAANPHASTVEGRMYLRSTITRTELLALEHYGRTVARFARACESPTIGQGPLASYQPSEPRRMTEPSGAAATLARRRFEDANAAMLAVGQKGGISAASVVSRVCRDQVELQPHQLPAFLAGVDALVSLYDLGPDPDRSAERAA